MNKKLLIVVVLTISVLSIILIAVWGTLPENNGTQKVDSISIVKYDQLNESNEKLIYIQNIVTEENNIYIIDFEYLPKTASANLIAYSSSEDVSVQIDLFNNQVIVYFSNISIGKNVTISIEDQKTKLSDQVTLLFKIPDVVIVD